MLLMNGIALANYQTDSCTTPSFESASSFSVGISPRSVAASDFNLDGNLDLAVANYGSGQGATNGNVSILLGNGSGGFGTATNLAVGKNPRSIVSNDFNNDGKADLALLVYGPACCISGFATVLLGDGAGNFTAAGTFAVGSDPSGLAVGDFNNDGFSDLTTTVLSSSYDVAILLGDGTGGFGGATRYSANSSARQIAVGDFNSDGKSDLVTANLNGFNVSILLGDGSGRFGTATRFDVGGNPQSVAVGDFNNDGKLDIVTANTSFSVSVLQGNGNGGFGTPTILSLPSSPYFVAIGDFNADGKADLATANQRETVSVLFNDGTGNFGAAASFTVPLTPNYVVTGDFNNDNKPDLVTANFSSNNITVLIKDDAGSFKAARSFRVGLGPGAMAIGDFNGDNKPDLVAGSAVQYAVAIILGDGAGGFSAANLFSLGGIATFIVAGDFNADGNLDVAAGLSSSSSIAILLGNGAGGFGTATNFQAGSYPGFLAAGDFNNDNKLDLATANFNSQDISILLGDGTGGFETPSSINMSVTPYALAVGDFNGDGNTDLVVTKSNGKAAILLGNGTGNFSSTGDFGSLAGPRSVVVSDFNGDGQADLAIANYSSTGTVAIFLGDGAGAFGPSRSFSVSQLARAVAVGDYNADGNVDLAVTANALSVLLGDGTGNFGTSANYLPNNGGFNSIVSSDFNSDNKSDLAFIYTDSDAVTTLFNTCSFIPSMPAKVSISDVITTEGDSNTTDGIFTVSLSAPSTQPVSVSYYTTGQSATSGVDYQAVSGRINFAPGVTTQTINVPVNGDTQVESDETFNVSLANPLNATISDGVGVATITNDDSPPPTLSINDLTINEESLAVASAVFTVRLSAASNQLVTVNYATADGTATAGSDYTAHNGGLFFAPGETIKRMFVQITRDTLDEPDETFFVFLSNPTNATISDGQGIGTILDNDPDPGTTGEILISEFRTSGPAGPNDEFIELYNNTDAPIDIRDYGLVSTIETGPTIVVDFGTVQGAAGILPARAHLLYTNLDGYSLSAYAGADFAVRWADIFSNNHGFALRRSGSGAQVDAVGFASDDASFREGAGLPVINAFPTPTPEYSYVRKQTAMGAQDTNDNAADFALVSTTGENFAGVQSILGAPGPENYSSPILHNDIATSLIDPSSPRLTPPNFVRVGSGNSGTLAIRRHFTNNTGAPITRLRFRVTDITTLGSPLTVAPPQADLRLVNSSDESVTTGLGIPITVKGTTLEQPPTQTNGGGLNSSMNVELPGGGLANGQSIDVQFLLNVVQNGRYRFFVNVEALP